MLAKKFITRSLKYNLETLPPTEREELQQEVRKSMERDKLKISQQRSPPSNVRNMSPSLLSNSFANLSI